MDFSKMDFTPVNACIRSAKIFCRLVVTLFSLLLIYVPLVPYSHAIPAGVEKALEPNESVQTDFTESLAQLKKLVAEKSISLKADVKQDSGIFVRLMSLVGLESDKKEFPLIESLSENIADQYQLMLEDFEKTREKLKSKGISAEKLEKITAAENEFRTKYQALMNNVSNVLNAEGLQSQSAAMDTLNEQLQQQKVKRTYQTTDPDNLPWKSPDADKTRQPAVTKAELSALTGIAERSVMLASNVITEDMLTIDGGPTAADLAETIDITFSDKVKAKAEELHDSPVEIYNWVRNNIEFIPSYGSIQGAAYTQERGAGNAFDTASLLIALLRAANIPARYAYGTVEIPAEEVMNWVGGVDNVEAAMNLLGQGGVPVTGMMRGGKIVAVRMETVWAEAWVDYFPSQGAKHVTGDSWIPLDASFKQYEYTDGQNLETNVPFDAQALMDDIQASATVNEDEGWVQGVSEEQLSAALENYQAQIEDYVENQNPDATVGDVLGTHKTIVEEHEQLAAGLPYTVVARSDNYSEIPDNLRHKFRYTLGTEYYGAESSRLITVTKSLPELSGKQIYVSFSPASEADMAIIESYLPTPDETIGEINPEDLPDTLPGYLISMNAELNIGNETVVTASAGNMGSELYETLALWAPSFGWEQAENHPITGEYRAIAVDVGINSEQAQTLQRKLEKTQAVLQNADATEMATLTKQDLVGDLLYSTIYSYFALNNLQDDIQSRSAGIVNYRSPSYGMFTTSLTPTYWFGMPRNVNFSGLTMDVDSVVNQRVAKDNDSARAIAFTKAAGARLSAMEHLVPEQMYSTADNPAYGISAVKAIALASAEGQKIWTIDSSNLATALAGLNLDDDVKAEIRTSVNAGKVVTTHTERVNFHGWTGEGYIILDPETGAGAYKISGGANGGILIMLGVALLLLALISTFILGPHFWLFLLTPSGQLVLGLTLSSAISLIARGIEIMTNNSGNSCGYANGAIGAGLGALLSLWLSFLPIAGILSGILLSGLLPCV